MAESKFAKLEHKLAGRKGVTDPRALAASIGAKKLGAEEMAKRSAASRRENERNSRDGRLRSRKRH